MRDDLVNLSIKAFNNHWSGLTVKYHEIPHYAYSSRYVQAKPIHLLLIQ